MGFLDNTKGKWFIFGVELFVVFILQSTPCLIPEIFGELPMLTVMCAVSIALFEGDVIGMWFGLGAGLLMDTVSSTPFGFYGLVLMITCFGCGTLVMSLMRNNIVTSLILGAAAVLVISLAQWFFTADAQGGTIFIITRVLLPRTLYSAAIMPIFYYFNRAIATRLYDE